jgi:23S rRNA (cytosine1962-C5)-methyltransferase
MQPRRADIKADLAQARAYRRGLARQGRLSLAADGAFRLVNDAGDGMPGLAIDVYAGYALVHLYDPIWEGSLAELADALLAGEWVRGVYATERPRGRRRGGGRHVAGAEAPAHRTEVVEHGLRYAIEPASGPATGLYLDQRDNRLALARLVAGGSLLNTFSYTCSFSLVAAVHGARTVSIDLAKAALRTGRENFARNGVPTDRHAFLADDVFLALPRLQRRGERFRAVLLDPPTFARGKKGAFSTEKDYERLAAAAAPLVAPGGHLVAFANTHRLSDQAWLRQVQAGLASAGGEFKLVQRWAQAPDFRWRKGRGYLKGGVWQCDE